MKYTQKLITPMGNEMQCIIDRDVDVGVGNEASAKKQETVR
jgi:hypothetical protein